MMYYIILFCSRNNALRFYDILRREGVDADLINAPKNGSSTCGLAVKVFDYEQARRYLSYGNYQSYQGAMAAHVENGRVYYTKID